MALTVSRAYISVSLRQSVVKRAGNSCEYCLTNDLIGVHKFHIDHIYNEAKGGPTSLDNLAYACAVCNHKKGENLAGYIAEIGQAFLLYHPRKDTWEDHFDLTSTGRLALKTNVAKAAAAQLKLNVKMLSQSVRSS